MEVLVIHSLNNGFWKVLDYTTYRFIHISSNYDDDVTRSVVNWDKRLQVQIKSQIFDSVDLFSTITFLSAFRLAWDTNRVHEEAFLGLLQLFMKHRTDAALNDRIAMRSKSHKHQKEGTITFYCKAVNYLLDTCVTDDVIAETYAKMMHFTQPSSKSLQNTLKPFGIRRFKATVYMKSM